MKKTANGGMLKMAKKAKKAVKMKRRVSEMAAYGAIREMFLCGYQSVSGAGWSSRNDNRENDQLMVSRQ